MKKKIEYNPHGSVDVTSTMKITPAHDTVLDKMKKSCLEQLNDDRRVTGFIEYRSHHHYDSEVGEIIKSATDAEVDACYELCSIGIFEQDYDAWNTTFRVAEGIDWTEM